MNYNNNKFLIITLCFIILLPVVLFAQGKVDLSKINESDQLILVVNTNWDSVKATLQYFERKDSASPWQRKSKKIPAVLGRTGLAWGDGIIKFNSAGPVKKEGDGKSPAGIFSLSDAFGFNPPKDVSWIKLPYFQITSNIECVDDINSKNYNNIVDRTKVDTIDWKSSEKMREIDQYEFGIFVDHNFPNVKKSEGSCIFIHIWGGPNSSTSGCTALAENNLKNLLKWLDPNKKPILVQFPVFVYKKIKEKLNLPD